MATANGFLNFLGGYSIFQGPVVAVMLVDYFIIRRGNITLEDLYTRSSQGRYYFFKGFNMRAFAAFVIGFILPLPGFAGTFGHNVGDAADHMFALGWVLSFLMGGLSYWVACMIFKLPGDDRHHSFESKVAAAQPLINEGFQIDGRPIHDKDSDLSQINSGPMRESKANGGVV